MSKPILTAVFAAFSALTLWVAAQIGLLNIWIYNINHPAGIQIFTDLGIALSLFMVWMWRDAKANARPFWPWALFTLAVGSFGPLLYLISAKGES